MIKQTKSNRLVVKALRDDRHIPIPNRIVEWMYDSKGRRTLYPESYLAVILSANHTDLMHIRDEGRNIEIPNEGLPHPKAWDKMESILNSSLNSLYQRIERD